MDLAHVERLMAAQSAPAADKPRTAAQVALRLKYRELLGSGSTLPSTVGCRVPLLLAERRGRHPALPVLRPGHGAPPVGRDLRRQRPGMQHRQSDHQSWVAGPARRWRRRPDRPGQSVLRAVPDHAHLSRRRSPRHGSRSITSAPCLPNTASAGTSTCCRWISTATDYWIWQALPDLRPRVVVLDSTRCSAPTSSSQPYDPKFQLDLSKPPYRCGASLTAFTRLAVSRGYRLVGLQSLSGSTRFFVRDDPAPAAPAGADARGMLLAQTERLRGWSQSWFDLMLEGGQRWDTV